MRILELSKRAYLLPVLVFGLLAFTACEDDEPSFSERLDGDWDVESFTSDGVEQMQSLITRFEMEFTHEQEEEGELSWTFIFIDGSTQTIAGNYVVRDGGKELRIDGDDFDMELDGDDLTLDGNVDGFRWEIEAERD